MFVKSTELQVLKSDQPAPSWLAERIDYSSYRLNFDLGTKNKIHHYSSKKHVKISKIAKFGCEML
jgi:hypothetical protein